MAEAREEVLLLRQENTQLTRELAAAKDDRHYVWTLWKNLQEERPDVANLLTTAAQREMARSEQRDEFVMRLLAEKDTAVGELQNKLEASAEELSEKLKERAELTRSISRYQDTIQRLESDQEQLKLLVEKLQDAQVTSMSKWSERERQWGSDKSKLSRGMVAEAERAKKEVLTLTAALEEARRLDQDRVAANDSLVEKLRRCEKQVTSGKERLKFAAHECKKLEAAKKEVDEEHRACGERLREQRRLVDELKAAEDETRALRESREGTLVREREKLELMYHTMKNKYEQILDTGGSKEQQRQLLQTELVSKTEHIFELQSELAAKSQTLLEMERRLNAPVNPEVAAGDAATEWRAKCELLEAQLEEKVGELQMQQMMSPIQSSSFTEPTQTDERLAGLQTALQQHRRLVASLRARGPPDEATHLRREVLTLRADNAAVMARHEELRQELEETRSELQRAESKTRKTNRAVNEARGAAVEEANSKIRKLTEQHESAVSALDLKLEEYKSKVSQLNKRLKAANTTIRESEKEHNRLHRSLQDAERTTADHLAELRRLKRDQQSTTKQVSQLQLDLESARQSSSEAETARINLIKDLVNGESPTDSEAGHAQEPPKPHISRVNSQLKSRVASLTKQLASARQNKQRLITQFQELKISLKSEKESNCQLRAKMDCDRVILTSAQQELAVLKTAQTAQEANRSSAAELRDVQKQLRSSHDENRDLMQAIKSLKDERTTLKSAMDALEMKFEQSDRSLKAKRQLCETQREKLLSVDSLTRADSARAQSLEERVQQLTETNEKLSRKMDSLRVGISATQRDKDRHTTQLQEKIRELDEVREKLSQQQERVGQLQGQLRALRSHSTDSSCKLEGAADELSRVSARLGTAHLRLAEFERFVKFLLEETLAGIDNARRLSANTFTAPASQTKASTLAQSLLHLSATESNSLLGGPIYDDIEHADMEWVRGCVSLLKERASFAGPLAQQICHKVEERVRLVASAAPGHF